MLGLLQHSSQFVRSRALTKDYNTFPQSQITKTIRFLLFIYTLLCYNTWDAHSPFEQRKIPKEFTFCMPSDINLHQCGKGSIIFTAHLLMTKIKNH